MLSRSVIARSIYIPIASDPRTVSVPLPVTVRVVMHRKLNAGGDQATDEENECTYQPPACRYRLHVKVIRHLQSIEVEYEVGASDVGRLNG